MMHALIAGHVLPSKSQKALPDVGGTTNKTTTTTATAKQLTEKERIKAVLPKFVLVPRKSYSPLRRSPLAPALACARSITVRASCDLPIEVPPSDSTRRLRDITNTNTNTSIAKSKSSVTITKIFIDEQRLAVKMRMRRQRKFDDEDLRRYVLVLRGRMAQRSPPPPVPQAEQSRGRPTTRTRSLTFPIPEKYSRRKDFGKPWAQRKAEILGENLPSAPFFQ